MQAYFLERLDASDVKAIKELVRVFCSNYGTVLTGEMPINAILPYDAEDYLELARVKEKATII